MSNESASHAPPAVPPTPPRSLKPSPTRVGSRLLDWHGHTWRWSWTQDNWEYVGAVPDTGQAAPCQGSCVGCGAGEDQPCRQGCACVQAGVHDLDGAVMDTGQAREIHNLLGQLADRSTSPDVLDSATEHVVRTNVRNGRPTSARFVGLVLAELDQARATQPSGATGEARPHHLVTSHWDAAGGEVLYRSCTCGEEWTRDEDRCPEDDVEDLDVPNLLDRLDLIQARNPDEQRHLDDTLDALRRQLAEPSGDTDTGRPESVCGGCGQPIRRWREGDAMVLRRHTDWVHDDGRYMCNQLTPRGFTFARPAASPSGDTVQAPDVLMHEDVVSFLDWLISMDDPENPAGLARRQTITLTKIIDMARVARTVAVKAPNVAALLRRLDEIEDEIGRYEWSAAGTLAPQATIQAREVRALLGTTDTEETDRG